MSAAEWATFGAAVVVITSTLSGVLLWIVRRIIRDETEPIKTAVMKIQAEVHPNGGKSLRDVVDRGARRLVRIESTLGIEPDLD